MNTETQIPDMSVADVAVQFPKALEVFNKHRIDYCCGGKRSFKEACEKAGIDSGEVWDAIAKKGEIEQMTNFKKWSPELLVDYILDQHHTYVRENIPLLEELLDKICEVHGAQHPELTEVRDLFLLLKRELLQHMEKEERILFPAIKMMRDASKIVPLTQPISVMKDEHELAGTLVKEIRKLTSNYTLPNDVCTTYRIAFNKLDAFDNDLMQHIHLENNILFEKVSLN